MPSTAERVLQTREVRTTQFCPTWNITLLVFAYLQKLDGLRVEAVEAEVVDGIVVDRHEIHLFLVHEHRVGHGRAWPHRRMCPTGSHERGDGVGCGSGNGQTQFCSLRARNMFGINLAVDIFGIARPKVGAFAPAGAATATLNWEHTD